MLITAFDYNTIFTSNSELGLICSGGVESSEPFPPQLCKYCAFLKRPFIIPGSTPDMCRLNTRFFHKGNNYGSHIASWLDCLVVKSQALQDSV